MKKNAKRKTFLLYFETDAEYNQFQKLRDDFKQAGFRASLFPMCIMNGMRAMIEQNPRSGNED
jgi:hypothetical protein